MKTVDVGAVLDEGRWTGYQKLLIFGTALTIILDGIDNQLLPNTIPALIAEWGGTRPDYVPALAWGPFGMMIGGVVGGLLGDRLGRRTALLFSITTFAILTLIIAFVPAGNVSVLGLLRFFAGVGLGGAMPNAATLSSEYVPRKQRPFAVTMTIICIPLGGVVAGFQKAIAGQKVGSTVAVAMTSADGYPDGQPSAGIEKGDTLIFAIKILGAS